MNILKFLISVLFKKSEYVRRDTLIYAQQLTGFKKQLVLFIGENDWTVLLFLLLIFVILTRH